MSLSSDYGLTVEVANTTIDAIYAGGESWTDITADVRALTIDRGVDGFASQPKVGTCQLVLNNTSSAYDPAVNSLIAPGAVFRVTADTSAAATKGLFFGFLPSKRGVRYSELGEAPIVTVNLWEPAGFLANYTLSLDGSTSLENATYGNYAGGQIREVLDLPSWTVPAASTLYDLVGGGAAELVESPGFDGTALGLIHTIAASDAGLFFFDRDGDFAYLDQHASITCTQLNTSQGTLSDDGADVGYLHGSLVYGWGDYSASRVEVLLYPLTYNLDDEVAVQYQNTPVVATNAGDLYSTDQTLSVQTHILSVPHAEGLADLLVDRFSQVVLSPDQAAVTPRASDTIRDFALDLDLMFRVTVEWTKPGQSQSSEDCLVAGIRHEITQGHEWVTSLRLFSATVWTFANPSTWLILDSVSQGDIDTDKIAP